MFGLKLNNVSNVHPFEVHEVVGRGSETRLKVDENISKITWWAKG